MSLLTYLIRCKNDKLGRALRQNIFIPGCYAWERTPFKKITALFSLTTFVQVSETYADNKKDS